MKDLDGTLKSRIHYYGMDLDPELLKIAKSWLGPLGLGKLELIRGNALLAEDYPEESFDFVVSTGLGEFLKPDEIEIFCRNVHRVLAPDGVFYTSATRYEKRSEAFLRTFELLTNTEPSITSMHSWTNSLGATLSSSKTKQGFRLMFMLEVTFALIRTALQARVRLLSGGKLSLLGKLH